MAIIRASKINSFTLIITTLITAITTIFVTLMSFGYFEKEVMQVVQQDEKQNKERSKDSLMFFKNAYNELQNKYNNIEKDADGLKLELKQAYKEIEYLSKGNSIAFKKSNFYESANISGQVKFNYSNNNGKYKIGEGEFLFITK